MDMRGTLVNDREACYGLQDHIQKPRTMLSSIEFMSNQNRL